MATSKVTLELSAKLYRLIIGFFVTTLVLILGFKYFNANYEDTITVVRNSLKSYSVSSSPTIEPTFTFEHTPKINAIIEQIPEINTKDSIAEPIIENQLPTENIETPQQTEQATPHISNDPMIQ